jgi:hypothetical protein
MKYDVTFTITVRVELPSDNIVAIAKLACDKLIATIHDRARPENVVQVAGIIDE